MKPLRRKQQQRVIEDLLRGKAHVVEEHFEADVLDQGSVDTAAKHKIKAIIQPGGSIRDEEVIAAADAADIAMVFTGKRAFLH